MAKNKELDTETAAIQKQGLVLKDLTKSEGWGIAKKRLIRKIGQLKMITGLDIQNATPETIIQVIASKNTAADILLEWLRDIEGTVEQHDGNAQLVEQAVEEGLLQIQD